MKLFGDFVFISGEKTVKDNNTYCSINAECVQDEEVVKLNCKPEIFDGLKKYQKYRLAVDVFEFTNKSGVKVTAKTVVESKAL